MPRTTRLLLLWLSVWLVVLSPAVGGGAEPTNRPRAWATKIDRPGLPNLYKINDGLYRGAQPTPEGIGQLEKMGVKTIVDLRGVFRQNNSRRRQPGLGTAPAERLGHTRRGHRSFPADRHG